MAKPMLIRQSPLTKYWYAFNSYREKNGYITVTGRRYDVTAQINAIIEAHGGKP